MRASRQTFLTGASTMSLLAAMVAAPAAVADHGPTDPVLEVDATSDELNVVGFLDLGLPGNNVTDVWAYGNYAYLGTFQDVACSRDFTGVHIVDISDPETPALANFIPSPPRTRANDVKVAHLETRFFTGEILVHSNEPCGAPFLPRLGALPKLGTPGAFAGGPGQGGVNIYDVTDPLHPKLLKQNFLKFPVHNTFIYQQDDNAYMLVVDDVNDRDVHIVDLTKPQSPKEIAVTGAPDWPGATDNIGIDEVFLHDVWAQETNGTVTAYLSYWDLGLVLLDITDPTDPVFLGDSDYPDPDGFSGVAPEGNSHAAVPNAAGSRVLMGDEDFFPWIFEDFSMTHDGTPVVGVEGAFTYPVGGLSTEATDVDTLTGKVVWTGGFGCTTGEIPAAPDGDPHPIALIQRGACTFQEKAQAAFDQGYAAFIVANDAARGDALVLMAGGAGPYPPIPGVFVGFSDGEAMKTAAAGALGGTVVMNGTFDGYGRLHLLDVSDPTNIIEVDGFATENVLRPPVGPTDRTMHNVVVDGTRAYISWYAEGIRVVSFTGDVLIEVAHFKETDVDGNSTSNFWGVYLHDHPDGNTYILGSDRGNGLWIFEVP